MEDRLENGFVVVHVGIWIQHYWRGMNNAGYNKTVASSAFWVDKLDRRITHLKKILKRVIRLSNVNSW